MRALLPILVALSGCDFSASTQIVGGDTAETAAVDTGDPGGAVVDTGADSGDDSSLDSGADSGADPGADGDGDGWSTDAGDCDDANGAVHPGATDACDGVDVDCDGQIDEDGADAYEPNDTTPTALGSLEDDPSRTLVATLTNAADIDRYAFTVVDDITDFFTLTATLSNIPSDASYVFTLNRLRSDGSEPLGYRDSVSGSGTLTLTFEDENFVEDGGDYELVVQAEAGADCARTYLLSVAQ